MTGDAKNPTRLDAHRDITIRALDTASIATLAGNAGVNLGGTAGVGVAFAYNDILDEVTATVTGTRLRSAIGGITVDAKFAKPTGLPPAQNSQIAAMAVSGGVAEDFAGAMKALAGLRGPVDAFFEKVLVNAEDQRARDNRLRLLAQVRAAMAEVADFGQVNG